ncbi:MAG: right-handed parallel beta-helix repeat-containing protein, partial [Chitinophagaceae bacterium]
MRKLLFTLLILCASFAHAQQMTDLKAGMKITSSVKVRSAVFALNAPVDVQVPVIEISGDNIVVDFNGAVLRGSNDKQFPDEFYGVAILVKGGKNITIKNLNARGYKVAIIGRDVQGLTIERCDLSYNYRQHLNSTQEKEDISDWMSYHQNEKDEWLRYGAAIYLRNCNEANVHNNIVTGGQCALMLTLCNDGKIYNNNFSFNSAIGIGMYRSSRNHILYNKLDWNVRGHSEGVYNRGQDSAAILVFEQCNDNIFARNSATHSGDGFFLWAGQTTMDTGEGGCNNNLLTENDFSHAPTNGVEVTFSQNKIDGNRIEECDHGIWGGYSYKTIIQRNQFSRNRIAIAIEHGQDNRIDANTFERNKESIRLWARKEQPKDWGYAQKRDTRSRNYSIVANTITGDSIVYNIINTADVKLWGNVKTGNAILYKLDSLSKPEVDSSQENVLIDIAMKPDDVPKIPNPIKAMLPANHPRGRKHIRITEWGPYDFRYPILWRTNPVDTSGLLKFELIGPKGKWRLLNSKGVRGLLKTSGSFPDVLTAQKQADYKGEILIELEYVGAALTTPFGQKVTAGQPWKFAFRDSRVPMDWQVKWFRFDSTNNPVNDVDLVNELQRGKPVLTQKVRDLNFAWWGGINAGGQRVTQFLTTAETVVDVEPGEYELAVTWDDAVRVILDGNFIVSEWNPSLYKFDESPNKKMKLRLGGRHTIKVEHAELGGFAT